MNDRPPWETRFVLPDPETESDVESHDGVDYYFPISDGPHPAIVFVHGGPVPPEMPTPRTWPGYIGYGGHTAARGAVGVVVDHPLYDLADYTASADVLAQAVEATRADPRVDADRVALWFFSGGGPLSADYLRQPPPWLRCIGLTYPVMGEAFGPLPERFRPIEALGSAPTPPIVLTTAGRDLPDIAATISAFRKAAADRDITHLDTPNGQHGFDMRDHTDESVQIVNRALDEVFAHLNPR